MQSQRITYIIAGLCLLFYITGCSHGPADYQIRDAISAYFKAKDVQVLSLEIQDIEREPLGARKYMGPERHIVHIPLITLKPIKTEAEPVDYVNVTITIRKNTDSRYGFSIDSVSGIP